MCEEGQRERKEQNAEDKEIEELKTRIKMLRKRDNKSTTEKIEYAELNKTVNKKRRTRARRKRKEFITKILEMKRGPKETRKDGCKKKISSMKDKNGERTRDREEMLNICKTYYTMKNYTTNRCKIPTTYCHLAQITPKYHLLPKKKWKRVSRRCQKGKHQGQTASQNTVRKDQRQKFLSRPTFFFFSFYVPQESLNSSCI